MDIATEARKHRKIISNKEQGISNVEVCASDHHSVFLVPCSIFNLFLVLYSYDLTAFINSYNFCLSSFPSVRTPLQISTAKGLTVSMASFTLPACNPPAKKTGILTAVTSSRLSSQLWVLPVPPKVLMAALGLPQ